MSNVMGRRTPRLSFLLVAMIVVMGLAPVRVPASAEPTGAVAQAIDACALMMNRTPLHGPSSVRIDCPAFCLALLAPSAPRIVHLANAQTLSTPLIRLLSGLTRAPDPPPPRSSDSTKIV
jgi:hypothetical protein